MDTQLVAKWVQDVVIREATSEDIPDMEWGGELTHYRNLYADAFHRAQKQLTLIWLAYLEQKKLAGQVMIQLNCERPELADGHTRAYLYGFRIRSEYRSHGLGTRIMNHVEDDLRRRGYLTLSLNVAINNPRARSLYTRLGFVVVAHEPGIWSYIDHLGHRQWVEEPAWRMEKNL